MVWVLTERETVTKIMVWVVAAHETVVEVTEGQVAERETVVELTVESLQSLRLSQNSWRGGRRA